MQENASDISVSDDYTTNSSDLVASTKCVYNAIQDSIGSGGILPGTIVAFSGQFGGEGNRYPIPLTGTEPDTHWCLCDGITTNNLTVPDLRGRMILGSSTEHTVGETGGSETHTHSVSGTVGATTLSTTQMPSHTHPFTAVISTKGRYMENGNIFNSGSSNTSATGGNGSHTHPLSGAQSGSASSLPPYYVLAYIMRCE